MSVCVYVWCRLRRKRPADQDGAHASQPVLRAPAGTYNFAAAVDAVVPEPASQEAAAERLTAPDDPQFQPVGAHGDSVHGMQQ